MAINVRPAQIILNSSLYRFVTAPAEHFKIIRTADQRWSVSPTNDVVGSEPFLGAAAFAAVASPFEGDFSSRTIS